MENLIIQGIGIIALIFVVLSFQSKKRYGILMFLWIAQSFFAVHFGLLEAWTAVAMNIIAAVRTYIFSQKDIRGWASKRCWPYLFIILFIAVGPFTWDGYHTLLPIIAQVIESIALWKRSPRIIRIMMLFPRPFWVVYNLMVGSYAGILTEIFVSVSILIGIYRYDSGVVVSSR
ncbi:hypothetical protein COV93_05560 [Candidatus Woesearchaeota archaeon CG11_big_fil_rev_8_21_14_0_20_43_8]|nr:MAG: hypothetical protein COV93_05560 [Candidatus Woesearchaeota archaeon CG11_big_fil_rev_8_21_14_0_20_43_8]PIO04808.1 MAG: hypothetical protein COT47_07440 [Candidatus Woesearchaeota archaeon CG08_land_8_20_14_0_20_43_7]